MITRRRRGALFGVAVFALSAADCGRKTAPKPPELIRPETLREVKARNVEDGIEVSWKRPREYVDGARMYDLAGFRIERGGENGGWIFLAERTVDDRDRFRQIKSFDYVDTTAIDGETYRYRVQSFTLDRDSSEPTESSFIVREIPPPRTPNGTPPASASE